MAYPSLLFRGFLFRGFFLGLTGGFFGRFFLRSGLSGLFLSSLFGDLGSFGCCFFLFARLLREFCLAFRFFGRIHNGRAGFGLAHLSFRGGDAFHKQLGKRLSVSLSFAIALAAAFFEND